MRVFFAVLIAIGVQTAQAQTPPALPAWPTWSNWGGLGTGSNYYPIMIWQTLPSGTTVAAGYSNAASAAIGAGVNVFLNYACPSTGYGVDDCDFASIPAASSKAGKPLYWIGGYSTDQYYSYPPSPNPVAPYETVQSITAMVSGENALSSLIGFNNGDEPYCGNMGVTNLANVPQVVTRTNADDTTRPEFWNSLAWLAGPSGYNSPTCESQYESAEAATNTMSADKYYVIDPYIIGGGPFGAGTTASARSNFGAGSGSPTSNDTLWSEGVLVSQMVQNAWTKTSGSVVYRQPVGIALSGGDDAKGKSSENGVMVTINGTGGAQVTVGSAILVNNTGWSVFSGIWQGLTVSGPDIPSGTTITGIVDSTHATMSNPATTTNTAEVVTVQGGAPFSQNNMNLTGDCLAGSTNLCVVNGNEYRETAEEAAAEAWMGVIAGADYLVYFPYDTCSYTFLLGDPACGTVSGKALSNIAYVNSTIQPRHAWLNSKTTALATMDSFNRSTGAFNTSTTASSGPVTVTTANSKVPGHVRVSGTVAGIQAVFAQPLRRGVPGSAAGETTLLVTNPAWANGTASVVVDTDQQFHASRALAKGAAVTVSSGGMIAIPFVDDYQTIVINVTLP